jgi:hypothetical protein
VRLYHVREHDRGDGLDARDEEECFTLVGRRVGVFLTTEASGAPLELVAEVDADVVAGFEVTAADAPFREFVVPGAVAAELGFVAI